MAESPFREEEKNDSTNSFTHSGGIRMESRRIASLQRLTHLITFRLAHIFGGAINHFHAEYHLFPVQMVSSEFRAEKMANRDDDVFL